MTAGTAYGFVVVVGAGSVATVLPAVLRAPPELESQAAPDAASRRPASSTRTALRPPKA